jgi:hypothetical protein
MPHFGLTSRAALYAFLQWAIRLNRAGMLAKMFRPGMHQEGFEIAIFFSESLMLVLNLGAGIRGLGTRYLR